jgi:hypothetical protein
VSDTCWKKPAVAAGFFLGWVFGVWFLGFGFWLLAFGFWL